jgi:hypothetical protein
MNQMPFEIIYEIHEFLDTCEDSQSFRQTCKFFNLLKSPYVHFNTVEKRRKWITLMFGFPSGQTLIHRAVKPMMSGDLFDNDQNLVCVFGKSKKLFHFALNELSSRDHVGGAVFGENEKMMKLLKQYSPSCSFFEFDDLERYVRNLHKIEKTMTRDEREQQSYVIIMEDDCRTLNKPMHRQLLMNSRCYSADVLMYFSNMVRIGPNIRFQIDVYLFKKTKNESDEDALKIFQNFGSEHNLIFDLYQKTFKTNFVLCLINKHVSLFYHLIDIKESLFESYLSDKYFWYHMHRKKI